MAGRLTAETDNGGSTITYTYDANNQLLGDGTTTHSYDPNGNRTDTGYTTGTGNEVTNDGTWTYTYDAEGNLTQKSKGASAETWTYGYDDENQMTWAQDRDAGRHLAPGGHVHVRRGRPPAGGRRDDAGGTTTVTRFGYDGNNAWADLNGSNALVTRRLFDNSE